MEKVLVTGGAGFIGSHVVDDLIKNGREVIVLDDLSGGDIKNVNPKAKFIKGSVEDVKLIEQVFKENDISYVFHLAAYAAEGLSHFIRRFNYKNNLIGSINLINASIKKKIKCFVFTSSIAVYGKNQVPMSESTIPMPEDPYGISKLAVEQDLRVAKEVFGLNYIIFRPHNIYGERQNLNDKYRNVLGIFINQNKRNKPLTIYGDGSQTRAFSYIGDISPVIARSIEVPEAYNQIFNIGADQPYSVNQLADVVGKAMNTLTQEIRHLKERKEVIHAHSNHEKVKRILGFKDETSLEEGVRKMVEWAKNVEVGDGKKFENIEITENLPESWI